MIESEFLEGFILFKPETKYTFNDKCLSKSQLETEEESIPLVAWEENAEILSKLNKDDKIIIKGYRKYNDFEKREIFIIQQFIKRFKD